MEKRIKLLEPFYVLTDYGVYWHHNFTKHLRDDLSMTPTTGYLSLFTKTEIGSLTGITGSYVDDTLSTGTDGCQENNKLTQQKFESSARDFDNITFAGIQIERWEGVLKLSQPNYAKELSTIPNCSEFDSFSSLRHKLAWIGHTRPDVVSPVNIIS